jgi:2-polyprenyl-3-methyl-5-hydroxy-6-metoxy-1,4-benzoquinol methylase
LTHWPIQLHLITPAAPQYRDADLLIAADCVAFSHGDFHRDFLAGRALDIGCAAGYFVSFLKNRGWNARGIDISPECVDAARSQGLDVVCGDYLAQNYDRAFDLITLWASIEHLHDPHLFLDRVRSQLADGGLLYISTCRTGGLNFMRLFGRNWRFYNFPEHLYFFSRSTMQKILVRTGFSMIQYRTYGSGLGEKGSLTRACADRAAKSLGLGDMMLVAARKAQHS